MIEHKVMAIEQKLVTVDRDSVMTYLTNKVKQVEHCTEFMSQQFDSIADKQKQLEKTQVEMNKIMQANDQMKADILDLKSRSMRGNLLFFNIPESQDEDCAAFVTNFCKEKLHIENAETIRLDRAHRIGKRQPNKTRPIVVKFNFHQDKENVRKQAKQLKGTNIGISEQFPREVNEKRKILFQKKREICQEIRQRE